MCHQLKESTTGIFISMWASVKNRESSIISTFVQMGTKSWTYSSIPRDRKENGVSIANQTAASISKCSLRFPSAHEGKLNHQYLTKNICISAVSYSLHTHTLKLFLVSFYVKWTKLNTFTAPHRSCLCIFNCRPAFEIMCAVHIFLCPSLYHVTNSTHTIPILSKYHLHRNHKPLR